MVLINLIFYGVKVVHGGRQDRHLHLLPIFGVKIKIKINPNIPISTVVMVTMLLLFNAERIATGYELDDGGSIPGTGKTFSFFPQCPDGFWVLPSPQSKGYWCLFPQG
jgi:hypothetical protein